jgi:chromosome segregation ATPase
MKSYSKIRHINEANQKLEREFLDEQGVLNTLKAGVQGAAKNIGTRVQNATSTKQKIRKSPKLEALTQKVKVRSEFLNKQLDFLKKELSEYKVELEQLKKNSPNYTKEIDAVIAQVDAYYNGVDGLVTQGNNLQNSSIQYFA